MSRRTDDNAYQAIFNAAQVVSLDARISTWLGENDPHALKQLRGAIKAVQAEIDTEVALRAMSEQFDNITDITFLLPEQKAALLKLLNNAASTLMLRGDSQLSQRLGGDVGRLLSDYTKVAK